MKQPSIGRGEKLRILRESDPLQKWQALEDKRFCMMCEKTINGHQIRVRYDQNQVPVVQCPSRGCPATPAEWLCAGNPLLSEEAWKDWLRILHELSEEPQLPAAVPVARQRIWVQQRHSLAD